ncbi:ladderlectin [Xyrauchen texanus]|uniref:ladderlectin n=1 Tax=Xyrauchen texanus TaxID=154827 RepID=UPI002241B373|nr:ladderlectin [Xyrauchen texanus]
MWISAAVLLFALVLNGISEVKSNESLNLGRRCPAGWSKFGSQCFKYFDEWKTWAEAEQQCIDHGGNLVSIHSAASHNFLKTFVQKQADTMTRTWIGGHDATQDYIWFWSDGSKFDYNDWHSGEPNNGGESEKCVEMAYGVELRWNDANCGTRLPSVCHKWARIEF